MTLDPQVVERHLKLFREKQVPAISERIRKGMLTPGNIWALIKGRSPEDRSPTMLEVGGLRLDRVRHRVQFDGKTIELSPREFTLLELLMFHPGNAVSRNEIRECCGWEGSTNIVDVYITYLRRKGISPIHTVRGVGYQIG